MRVRIDKKYLEGMKMVYEEIGDLLNNYSDEFELTDENFKNVKRAKDSFDRLRRGDFGFGFAIIDIVSSDGETIRLF